MTFDERVVLHRVEPLNPEHQTHARRGKREEVQSELASIAQVAPTASPAFSAVQTFFPLANRGGEAVLALEGAATLPLDCPWQTIDRAQEGRQGATTAS